MIVEPQGRQKQYLPPTTMISEEACFDNVGYVLQLTDLGRLGATARAARRYTRSIPIDYTVTKSIWFV